MKAATRSSHEDFWETPPYLKPLDRIRTMMSSLDKELAELYRRKTLELAGKIVIPDTPLKVTPVSPVKTESKESSKKIPFRLNSSKGSLSVYPPCGFSFERYKMYKTITLRAYQNRKIFTIYGNYGSIRHALLKRGWVEKLAPNNRRALPSMSQHSLLKNAKEGNDYEAAIISRLLDKYPSYFVWQPKSFKDWFGYALPYRNRIRRTREFDFTTKDGLLMCIDNTHFYTSAGVSQIRAPRCHRLGMREEVAEFLKDFRLTYCRSLLLFIQQQWCVKPIADQLSGTIPLDIINFAIKRLNEAIEDMDHADINESTEKESLISSEDWESFVTKANKIINGIEKFKADTAELLQIVDDINKSLNYVKKYFPMMESDGYNNIWILKPSFFCRGNGIVLMKSYEDAINFSIKRPKLRYIAQKYIERPLLIYKTKFDIRLYMLMVVNDHVNIWLYKDCYLKFSSQEFSLTDLREQIHLTNNSVQKKYKNGERSDKLPTHNMWNVSQFKSYLNNTNQDDMWAKKIIPGIKENIIAVVLASLEETDLVTNTFEIYGCDFMVDDNYNPILLEVNATPDMSPSTCVTAKICPAALEDLVKVIVDLPKNPKASTGDFELIYQVQCTRVPEHPNGLTVEGKKIELTSSSSEAIKTPTKTTNISVKKKFPKVITEKDVRDGAISKTNAESRAKVANRSVKIKESNSIKKRKRGGAVTNKTKKQAKPQVCNTQHILQKSVELLNSLNSHSMTDSVVGQKIKAVMNGICNPPHKTKKLTPEKAPGRLSAGEISKIPLASDVKEFLALRTTSANKRQEQLLIDFLEIILKKAGGLL